MKKGKLHRSRRYRPTTILSTMATIDVKTALSTASQNHDTLREIRYAAGWPPGESHRWNSMWG
jgi:hypothetical protein